MSSTPSRPNAADCRWSSSRTTRSTGPDGPVRLVDVFDGRSQLIVYNHMWSDGAEWQCGGCTSLTSQYVRLGFLDNYDARFVIVTNGPIDEALAYKAKVGNEMDWYSSSDSPFSADVGAPPGVVFAMNVFLRDGDTVYRTWHTDGRGTEQTQLHVRVGRHPAVGPPGGVAGLPRRLAAVPHLLRVARLSRRRPALRTERSPVQPPSLPHDGAGSRARRSLDGDQDVVAVLLRVLRARRAPRASVTAEVEAHDPVGVREVRDEPTPGRRCSG